MAKLKSGFTGERAIVMPTPVVGEMSHDTLGSLLQITDIGFYPRAISHYRKRSAAEAMQYILIYCVDGSGWVSINQKQHSLSANQLIVIPGGVEHSYGSNDDDAWTIYWIHFEGSLARFFSQGLDAPLDIPPSADSRIEERIKLFEEMYAALRNGFSISNLNYCSTVLFHFLGTVRYPVIYRGCRESTGSDSGIIERSIHYLRENIHRRLTLSQIATYSGLSVSHFTTLFQQKTGFPPISYFLQLKIQQACHLLDFSDMKVNQISSSLGFSDALYFSRIFTRTMGLSPVAYRRKKKG